MLKAYAVEDLKPGMIIGRDVSEDDVNILIQAGTVLTQPILDDLMTHAIFSVEVREGEETKAEEVPRSNLLDDAYVSCYERVYEVLADLLKALNEYGTLDLKALQRMIGSSDFRTLSNGAKAISQIHNMDRTRDYIVHHSLDVGILASLMGRWLSLTPYERYDLIVAGLFMDVGKMRISDNIINKHGKLTATEYGIVKNHTKIAVEMLEKTDLSTNRKILDGVLQHHERTDGSGYPMALTGNKISDFGRILALLDMYDAMASTRSYAKRVSPFHIFDILHDDVLNNRLDVQYAVLFMRRVCHALNGSWVRLNDGTIANIVYMDESRVTTLPVVQTTKGEFIDLNTMTDKKIACILTARELADERAKEQLL